MQSATAPHSQGKTPVKKLPLTLLAVACTAMGMLFAPNSPGLPAICTYQGDRSLEITVVAPSDPWNGASYDLTFIFLCCVSAPCAYIEVHVEAHKNDTRADIAQKIKAFLEMQADQLEACGLRVSAPLGGHQVRVYGQALHINQDCVTSPCEQGHSTKGHAPKLSYQYQDW